MKIIKNKFRIKVIKNNRKDSITFLIEKCQEQKVKSIESNFPEWKKLFS